MGILSLAIAIVAFGIYIYWTLYKETEPHPMTWFGFGVCDSIFFQWHKVYSRHCCFGSVRTRDSRLSGSNDWHQSDRLGISWRPPLANPNNCLRRGWCYLGATPKLLRESPVVFAAA